jgi:hypothetical protein
MRPPLAMLGSVAVDASKNGLAPLSGAAVLLTGGGKRIGQNGFMAGPSASAALPVIDVGPLTGAAPAAARAAVAEQIQVACREMIRG